MGKLILKCTGCGIEYDIALGEPLFCCKNIGTDRKNHILSKTKKNDFFKLTDYQTALRQNPYKVFKKLYYSYWLSEKYKIDFEKIIDEIDETLNKMGEPVFKFTDTEIFKLTRNSKEIKVIIKNETKNVAGSHKARHLMGNILYFEVLRKAGIIKERPELAIYSCGNAAMGAAAIAKAAEYKLKVFIPEGVNFKVIDILNNYAAEIIICKRIEGESGDPCYLRFHEALKNGAMPFSCSGPDNWSNIEGGQSLTQELFAQAKQLGRKIDSIVLQVGGGALASSAIQTIEDFTKIKIIDKLPKVFTVQTKGGYPLVRAYYLLLKDIAANNALKCSLKTDNQFLNSEILSYIEDNRKEIKVISEFIKNNYKDDKIQNILKEASLNREKYMWPWETEPHSIAHGILDDITYDWFKIIQGMFMSGGISVIVDESEVLEANKIGKELTGIKADYTGTSGFAGLLKFIDNEWITEENTPAVLFTGAER